MREHNGDFISSYIAEIARDIFPKYEYHGLYRYQVFQQTDDKLELQALKKRPGLPDILPVEMFPGVAGAFSNVKNGSTALVMFIDGSPTQPIVVGFAPKSEGNLHYPNATVLNALDRIDIGSDNLDNPVKWAGFQEWAGYVRQSIEDVITALLAVAAAVPYTVTPVPLPPNDPPTTAQATKVWVE